MTKEFLIAVFELAFGDGAADKGYTNAEVLSKLREFSDDALKWTTLIEELEGNDDDEADWELLERLHNFENGITHA